MCQELVMVRSSNLPREPGVYVVRVIEKGKDIGHLARESRNMVLSTGWLELIDYIYPRLERLYRIRGCSGSIHWLYRQHTITL